LREDGVPETYPASTVGELIDALANFDRGARVEIFASWDGQLPKHGNRTVPVWAPVETARLTLNEGVNVLDGSPAPVLMVTIAQFFTLGS
jgi:hypothetical protein